MILHTSYPLKYNVRSLTTKNKSDLSALDLESMFQTMTQSQQQIEVFNNKFREMKRMIARACWEEDDKSLAASSTGSSSPPPSSSSSAAAAHGRELKNG
jgi:hypothetical protein